MTNPDVGDEETLAALPPGRIPESEIESITRAFETIASTETSTKEEKPNSSASSIIEKIWKNISRQDSTSVSAESLEEIYRILDQKLHSRSLKYKRKIC